MSVPKTVIESGGQPPASLTILNLPHVERIYWRGMSIYMTEDQATHIYTIIQGRVKILRLTADGHQKILAIRYRGDLFGEQVLDDFSPRRSDEAIAMEDSRIAAIRIEDFWRLARQNSALAQTILQCLSAHLSAAHRQIESLVFENNSRRLVRALFALGRDAARIGISSIRMTHEELAGLIGASRESVTNLMVELRRQGLIEYKRGEVHPCLPKLARFLAQDD